MTRMRLDNLSTSTTLESNKSLVVYGVRNVSAFLQDARKKGMTSPHC
jgi:hypothetical protein